MRILKGKVGSQPFPTLHNMGNCCKGKKSCQASGSGAASTRRVDSFTAEVITPRFHPQVSPRTMDPPALPIVLSPPVSDPVPALSPDPIDSWPPVIAPIADSVPQKADSPSPKESDEEAEALTAPFAVEMKPWEPRTNVPKLNLDFVSIRPKVSGVGEPSILCSQPWTEDVPREPGLPRDDYSLTVSSSSGVAFSGLSKEQSSSMGLSALGFSSEASQGMGKDLSRILPMETSGQSSSSLLLRVSKNNSTLEYSSSAPKEPLSLILERSSMVFDCEDEVENVINCPLDLSLKLTKARDLEPKAADTSLQRFTFRPLLGHAKRTSTILVTTAGSKTFLNDYRIVSIFESCDQGNLYRASRAGQSYLIREYSKATLSQIERSQGVSALDSLREMITLQEQLNHPNILQLLEVIEKSEEDIGYLVFEGVQGQVSMLHLNEEDVWDVFRQLVRGVCFLHMQAGVAHLAIRPEILLITSDNLVKIADFSLAQSIKTESLRRLEAVPDFQGRPVDIWACGVTLHLLLYGSSPFSDRETSAIYDLIRTER